ncbi:hypothetical protein CBS101457_004180 [Exobasidium rhododendri]|nr:hypothetical protein CBS101457_004180 [Exobasidium rhododendri]
MDPVASRAAGMLEHMNKDHEDSMIAIVLQHNKQLTSPPRKAKMTKINSKGFTIEYQYVDELFWNPSGKKKEVQVPFTPAIKEASEVRARLVSMSQDAEEKLPKRYPVKFAIPRDLPLWVVIFFSLTLMSNPAALDTIPPVLSRYLVSIRESIGGIGLVSIVWKGLIAAHFAEATAMTVYLNKRGASRATVAKWALSHFFIGFPTYFAFKKLNPDVPAPSLKQKKH